MAPKICIDRVLPQNLTQDLAISRRLKAVAPKGKQWINGSTLRIFFMGGTEKEQNIVKEEAGWWERHANIRFEFVHQLPAEIRITFDSNDGAWSYVGTDCAAIPQNEPTMNLGFLDRGTAAHEFGHALGLGHEHQNPQGGIKWNEFQVYNDLAGPPNYWDRETTYHNVLRKYSQDNVNSTQFDPHSIMLYWFPKEWTMNGLETKQNSSLSENDIQFIGSSAMYPKAITTAYKNIFANNKRRTYASIGKPGEEDLFSFVIATPGHYRIDTRGDTDVMMRLFGPNSHTALLAEDDNGGICHNAEICMNLVEGVYFVQVRHADPTVGIGKYSIKLFGPAKTKHL